MQSAAYTEAAGKANRRNPAARAPEESDGDIVPGKSANKGKQFPAEWMEERSPTERNGVEHSVTRPQSRFCCVRMFTACV